MVFLNEWLPNPVGADAAGEFIELYNDGAAAAPLDGWSLRTESGKTSVLHGRTVPPRGFLVLDKDATKLALRNTDGGLSLYAPGGTLADGGSFAGAAPEGKSYSRANYDTGPATHFAWAAPTPGTQNPAIAAVIVASADRYGVALDPQFTAGDFFAIMMGTAALVTALIFYIIKDHEDLSKLFAPRDETIWRSAGKARGGGDAPRCAEAGNDEAQPHFR